MSSWAHHPLGRRGVRGHDLKSQAIYQTHHFTCNIAGSRNNEGFGDGYR